MKIVNYKVGLIRLAFSNIKTTKKYRIKTTKKYRKPNTENVGTTKDRSHAYSQYRHRENTTTKTACRKGAL